MNAFFPESLRLSMFQIMFYQSCLRHGMNSCLAWISYYTGDNKTAQTQTDLSSSLNYKSPDFFFGSIFGLYQLLKGWWERAGLSAVRGVFVCRVLFSMGSKHYIYLIYISWRGFQVESNALTLNPNPIRQLNLLTWEADNDTRVSIHTSVQAYSKCLFVNLGPGVVKLHMNIKYSRVTFHCFTACMCSAERDCMKLHIWGL